MSPTPSLTIAAALLTLTTAAVADYADPPDGPVIVAPGPMNEPRSYAPDLEPPRTRSTLRAMTGPAARIWDTAPEAGLFVALEAGRGAAGARASAAWIGVGHSRGLAQYTGELWIAFDVQPLRLRPSVAAGGGLAQVEPVTPAGGQEPTSIGVGILRGGLAYLLPVRGTDARLGLDLSAVVPAIRDPAAPEVPAWLIGAASVAIGF